MSELIGQAFREYERKRLWDEINVYGREKAAEVGITEEDVPNVVKQWRKEQRGEAGRLPR